MDRDAWASPFGDSAFTDQPMSLTRDGAVGQAVLSEALAVEERSTV